ncbi:kinesin-like protein KIF20B isoform X2 [Scophthalmus maximus]|uniref:kinesin-like protein KIF20B isoform X2 n=1 Tax=Scophthalmus maximus TaxID=52904 RepID=UPI001FA84BCE|nr:kinesin-like protein KIF20B isoform X2 [Scophthalmus maximus]
MMESVLSNRPHGRRQSEVDQSKGDVSLDSSTLPHSQLSSPEEREHLQVYLRIRPFTSAESTNGESQDCVSMEPPDTVLLKPPCSSLSARLSADRSLPQTGQRFQFSQVYGPETTQTQMFEGTVKDLVTDVLQGGNSLVFTYGVTNAGKTFTFLGPDADAGILPRSLDVIFSSIDEHVFSETCFKPHRCREFTRLTREQQAEEAAFKRNLFRQLKESERSNTSLLHSTNKTLLEGSSVPGTTVAAEDRIHLQVETHTKFSVWVSFCEIYNENIHDLLEAAPSGAPKRTVLRLSQDVKGNAFVKDLRWVQVNGADEAYKVMKLGKKNQSFSATRLNQLSSRSHSIFSIRILRLEDVGTPRVHNVSELCLCDLAGSERCAKTQNQGERLKEAGNINTSLLILGKCINALRHNQQAKLLQHIPFRESKLTHYLQGFFCGRGKACMIVNINQCASMYDETLNVLKFSAVAQKVVVLSTRPVLIRPLSSAVDESLAVNAADGKCPRSSSRRRSSVIGWESSLEDVQEDVDDEFEEESVLMDDTMDQTGNQGDGDISSQMHQQGKLVQQLQQQLKKERADGLLMEARVREEISREFSELFSEMQSDYNERLAREREILEERAETRLEIFKNLIDKMTRAGTGGDEQDADKSLDCTSSSFSDLAEIKMAAEAARKCLGSGRAGTVEELERKVLELHEHQRRVEEQEAHKHLGQTVGEEEEEEERRTLLSRLREKSSEISRLEKQVEDLQGATQRRLQGEGESQLLQEAQAALEMEKEARADVLSALEYQTLGKEEALASLEEERKAREELRRGREETLASLEKERQDKETLAASLAEANRRAEETLAALDEERRRAEEARSLLEEERTQIGRLTEQRQVDALQQEVGELAAKLQAAERQLTAETQRAERASVQLEEQSKQINVLMLENHQLRDQVSELGRSPAEEKQKRENEQLEVLNEDLRKKLQEQEETSQRRLDELASKLESRERESREEVEQLRAKLLQGHAQETQLEELKENLQEQRASSLKQLEELKHKLSEQEDLKLKLSEQQGTVELLKVQLEGSSAADQELKRLNSELQTEVAALRAKVSVIEETKESASDAEAGRAASAEREAELQKTLRDKEAEVTTLQKKLQEAQERRDEDELQAVQDARRREVERRRELLAVAHEAIAQKDEELDKRGEEISRLKEKAEQHSERVKSLDVELQRKDDDASDLREKLADYKKQIQQVQKEISTMREDEKVLRQKLSDAEKTRKQLQSDVANRDRIIQQLRAEQSSDSKSDQTLELYQKTCKELEAKQQVMDDMRLALTEQEETQAQMDDILEEKLLLIQELSHEVEKLKAALLQQDGEADARRQGNSPSHDLRRAKQEAAQAQESLKLCADKHQAERRKWLEEKLSLIGQAKEAEDKRNQEMRKFADDRERYARQQSHVDSLSSRLAEQQQTMDTWRTERDTLVAALEVQLQKLLSSHVEKDKLIQELQQNPTQPPPECGDGGVAELQAALRQREADVQRLEAELKASTVAQTESKESPAALAGNPQSETLTRKSAGQRETRASVSSQGSAGGPSVLDSFEISTENGRASRFPRPELEISFSPLQPNRMALRRQGEENAVTVKITRSARKRKSGEMEKSHIFRRSKRRTTREAEVEAENRRNTRTKLTSKLTTHTEETSSPAGRHDSHSSIPSRKEGTLQKIGDFLQSSPTLLGSKAKKMMSLVSGRIEADSAASSSSSSSSSLRAKMNKRKLYRPEISSPMDLPAHPIISREPEERDSDHSIIKRRLRSRMVK